MKKFVTFCACVAALSFVSCGNKTNENATVDSISSAIENLKEEATERIEAANDSLDRVIDSAAVQIADAVEAIVENSIK